MQQYLILALCLLCGQVFHLLIKANAMRKRAAAGNVEFHIWRDFIWTDILEIIATFMGGILVMLALKEIKGFYPSIEDYLRIIFILLGYSGSSLVLSALSKGEKKISQAIDEKTNTLDELTQTNMEHWVFEPVIISPNDMVVSIGNQPFNIAASEMSAATQGMYYTQTISGSLYLCANIQAFSSPINAIILPSGSQQGNVHVPIKRPK